MKREEQASACVLIENTHISKGLRANANCRWKYSYRYIYSCIGICNADTPLHSLQLSKKRKLCRQKPHPRARSLWLEDFHRYPMAAWKNIIAFTVFTVVWVAPEKFRSLPPLPPSILPSFLPSVSFRRRRHCRPSITRVKVISQLVLAQRPWSHIRYIPAQRSAVLSLGHTGLRSRVRLLAGSQAKTGKGRQAGK